MADATRDEAGEEPIEVPKKSKLPLIIAAVALIAGGVGAFVVLRPAAKPAGKEAKKVVHGEEEAAGIIITLAPFIVNLADEDTISYLKCTIAVEVADKELAPLVERKTVPVRNAIIMYLSSLTLAETKGTKNKEKILTELTERLGEILGKEGVTRVYMTEFVIQ